MVNILGGNRSRRASTASSKISNKDVEDPDSAGPEDGTTVVEPEQGNVLSHIISQLRPGADLSRVVLPTFILEPRSMLERITNFMAHPEMLLHIPEIEDPTERFVSVVKFYLSGWHIKPPGVKKPLNPILGETFTCHWNFDDDTRGYYISEQTSHHPPKSSYFYLAPEHNIRIDGCLKPRSKFLGNSAASLMEGIAILRFLNRGKDPKGESYFLTQPNMYARGILFGKMKYELGDNSIVRCPELGLVANLEFKTKGYFSGTYNAIGGNIKDEKSGQVLYELSGMWSGEMTIKNVTTGQRDMFFNAATAKHTPPSTRPMDQQGERESQRLWFNTAEAVKARNHELATDEKTKIEDRQREEAAKRAEIGEEWQPKLFRKVRAEPGESEDGEGDLDFILNAEIDAKDPKEQTRQVLAVAPILPDQYSLARSEPIASHPKPQEGEGPTPSTPTSTSLLPAHRPGVMTSYRPAVSSPLSPTRPQAMHFPSDLRNGQTDDGGRQQRELEETLKRTGTQSAPKGPLLDFADVKDAVDTIERKGNGSPAAVGEELAQQNTAPPHGTLKRMDTDGISVDEFVDAEE